MRTRPRPTCSFRPTTDELEKLVGASSLAFGDLAAAALPIVHQPSAVDLAVTSPVPGNDAVQASAIVNSHRTSSSFQGPESSRIVVVLTPAAGESKPPHSEQPSQDFAPLKATAGGMIRPLSLAPSTPLVATPSQPTITLTAAQPISRPIALGSAVGAGGGGSPSSGVSGGASLGDGGGISPMSTGGVNGATQAQTVVSLSNGATPVGSGTSSSTAANAVAARIANANSISSRAHNHTNTDHVQAPSVANRSANDGLNSGHRTGGTPLANEYVATGGSRTPSESVFGNPSGGSGGGTGTGTGTTSGYNTASCSGSASSASGTTSTPGNWSIPSPSGGAPYTGTISILPTIPVSGGGPLIGSSAGYTLKLQQQNGVGATLSDISWSSSGQLEMYSGQIVPNPTALGVGGKITPGTLNGSGSTRFQNTVYTLPVNQPGTNPNISFKWGETPGDEQLVATATIWVDTASTTAEAKTTIHVAEPGLAGGPIYYLASASVSGGALKYSNGNIPGIDWRDIQPAAGQGTFKTEQLLTGATITYTSTSSPATYKYAPVYINPTTLTPTYPSYPLLDLNLGTTAPPLTTPFYEDSVANQNSIYISSDSPSQETIPSYSLYMSLVFTDYVMFNPGGGIWVPEIRFSWHIIATAWSGSWGWHVSTISAFCSNPIVKHSYWPVAWTDIANKYGDHT